MQSRFSHDAAQMIFVIVCHSQAKIKFDLKVYLFCFHLSCIDLIMEGVDKSFLWLCCEYIYLRNKRNNFVGLVLAYEIIQVHVCSVNDVISWKQYISIKIQ